MKFVNVNPVKVQITDALKDKDASDIQALNVRLAATHLGYVNENKFRYVDGDATDNSLKSWTKPFQKPVVTFHNDQEDPLGRVYDARREEFHLQDGEEKENRPTGVVVLDALITDPDAIKKVLDGSYLTVSTSCSSKNIECSICGSNVALKDEKCDHQKGKTYDGKDCVWEVGERKYTEVSFVNTPADQSDEHFAGVISIGDDTEGEAEEVVIMKDSMETIAEAKEATVEVKIEDETDGIKETVEDDDVTQWTAHDFKLATSIAEKMKEQLGDAFYNGEDEAVFCGPHSEKNSTFPLPDMEHVEAALAILDDYRGRGSKAKLTSEVLQKKASFEPADNDQDFTLTEKIADLEKEIGELKEQLTDEKVLEHPAVLTKLEDVQKEIEAKSETISKLQAKHDSVKAELDDQQDEAENIVGMVDENVRLFKLVKRLRATLLVDLQIRTGKIPDLVKSENFLDARMDTINTAIKDMDGEDIVSAYNALATETNFGTYQKPNEPTETTENPALDNDPSQKISDSTTIESGPDTLKRVFLKKKSQ